VGGSGSGSGGAGGAGGLGGFDINLHSTATPPSAIPSVLASSSSASHHHHHPHPPHATHRPGSGGGDDASMIPLSSPVMASPLPSMWREGNGKASSNKRKAEDRFEGMSKRRAVSPSTVLFPNNSNISPFSNLASTLSMSTNTSSSTSSGLASPTLSHSNLSSGRPAVHPPLSIPASAPIPISSPFASAHSHHHSHSYSRSSRAGSPIPQSLMSTSATSVSGGRSLGGSAPGIAGAGLGLTLLQREREGARRDRAMSGIEDGGEILGKMRLGDDN
jgi:hypothetical protein